jgi:hypothetical protein
MMIIIPIIAITPPVAGMSPPVLVVTFEEEFVEEEFVEEKFEDLLDEEGFDPWPPEVGLEGPEDCLEVTEMYE